MSNKSKKGRRKFTSKPASKSKIDADEALVEVSPNTMFASLALRKRGYFVSIHNLRHEDLFSYGPVKTPLAVQSWLRAVAEMRRGNALMQKIGGPTKLAEILKSQGFATEAFVVEEYPVETIAYHIEELVSLEKKLKEAELYLLDANTLDDMKSEVVRIIDKFVIDAPEGMSQERWNTVREAKFSHPLEDDELVILKRRVQEIATLQRKPMRYEDGSDFFPEDTEVLPLPFPSVWVGMSTPLEAEGHTHILPLAVSERAALELPSELESKIGYGVLGYLLTDRGTWEFGLFWDLEYDETKTRERPGMWIVKISEDRLAAGSQVFDSVLRKLLMEGREVQQIPSLVRKQLKHTSTVKKSDVTINSQYYTINLSKPIKKTLRKISKSLEKRRLAYRYKRQGAYHLRVRRGPLPMEFEDHEKYAKAGYKVFLGVGSEPSDELVKDLKRRGHETRQADEWLAVKKYYVRDTTVGDKSLPYKQAIRKVERHEDQSKGDVGGRSHL